MKANNIILYLMIVLLSSAGMHATSRDYRVKLLVGAEIEQVLPFVTSLWAQAFGQYPYLYRGTSQEADDYFRWIISIGHSAMAIAYCDDKPVGFLSGASFIDFGYHYTGSVDCFRNAGLPADQFYYFAEGIIMPEHRGQSVIGKLSDALTHHAVACGYTKGCFITESHDVHPLKPKEYKELDGLWMRFGYSRTDLQIPFIWRTIQPDGSVRDQEHRVTYWIKDLK